MIESFCGVVNVNDEFESVDVNIVIGTAESLTTRGATEDKTVGEFFESKDVDDDDVDDDDIVDEDNDDDDDGDGDRLRVHDNEVVVVVGVVIVDVDVEVPIIDTEIKL